MHKSKTTTTKQKNIFLGEGGLGRVGKSFFWGGGGWGLWEGRGVNEDM